VKNLLISCAAVVLVAVPSAQNTTDPAAWNQPPRTEWPTYNGDYSGRRFSPLTKINVSNVDALSLAWMHRVNLSANIGGGGGGSQIKATPLQIGGILYFALSDHAVAVDARTGREVWHYTWASKGGIHLGSRGVAIAGDTLYFETPDCHVVALNVKDGTHKWDKEICDLDLLYYASVAPLVVKNHLIAGVSGDDLDVPGYVDSLDLATGERQWRWYVVPQTKDEAGSDTWPNLEAAKHGGGMTWQPFTYDAELNLVYITTGNPQPVIAHANRAGANLFTASIVALNPDTGKMVWYFQASPHDTHDWDATQPAVVFDGEFNGQPRKMIAQASRNGKFFVLDRTNGKALVSSDFVYTNWSKGYDAKGQPIPDPAKMPQIDGALVTPNQGGATNWPPVSFSPQTGLLYVPATQGWSMWYLYDPSDNPQGWGGTDRGGYSESLLIAMDYKTGKPRWTHKWEGSTRTGVLSTAGNLVFTGGPSSDLVALNATTGDALWHARLNAGVSNGPISYEMDGRQYVIVGAGDTLWAFVMNK
jgi:alcohol dehydrogenase (cytochrome c)